MATIDRSGVTIYYEYHKAAKATAPTVLLSHGYSATAAMWDGQIEALTASHHVITWDMRGHGRSDSPDDATQYSEEHTVEDIAALLDVCDASSGVIGGLSLGGYMTLAFHATYPEKCDALMLFDTGPGYKSETGRAGWNQTARQRGADLDAQGLAALGAGAEVRVSQHRSAAGLAHAARGMLAQVDDRVIQSLPGIDLPTLVLVGANDAPFLVPSDYMAGKIPGARKVVLADAGHASNLDQPEAFNREVRAFLKSAS